MTNPVRFLFDNDFAAPPPDAAVPEEELTPMIPVSEHEARLAQVEAEAVERGRREGEAGAVAAAQNRLAADTERLADAANRMIELLDADMRRIEGQAVDLCAEIARRIAGHALEAYPHAQILALIEECLSPLRRVRHLAIRVNEDEAEHLKEPIETLAAKNGFEGRLLILGEPDTAPGDCRIEWADGGILFERQNVLQAVNEAVETFLADRGGTADPVGDNRPDPDETHDGSGPDAAEVVTGPGDSDHG